MVSGPLPGGYADVGLTAKQNIEKEIEEEAGLTVIAARLYSVRHKASGTYRPDPRDIYKLFFICDCESPQMAQPGLETSDVGFFTPDDLPALSDGRTIVRDIHDAFVALKNSDHLTIFD